MKSWLSYLAIASCALMLQGCGGGSSLGDNKQDTDTLQPIPPEKLPDDRARPTPTIPVITAKKTAGIVDAYGAPVLLRGVDIKFGDDPTAGVDAILAAKAAGSNVVRLLVQESTTDLELEGALVKVVENNMVAIVSLTSPKVTCVEDDAYLISSVESLYRKKWLTILAEDRFQSNLMINIADGWGPNDIFSPNSFGYQGYLDTYKALIRLFRKDGFKVPLVIDAPGCGEDFNAFLAGRGREMQAADSESNIILSVQANGEKWNSNSRLLNAVASLNDETVPYIMTSFKGSGVGDSPVDHLDIMKESAGNHALSVNIPWVTPNDMGAYTTKLSKPTDLRGGAAVSLNALIDNRYFEMEQNVGSEGVTPKGKLNLAIYIKDINGNRLKLSTYKIAELRPNTWNAIRVEVPKGDIDVANLMAGATGFDTTQVTEIGLQLLGNGQTAKAKGEILFDDVQVWPGVPPMYEANFKTDTDSWSLGWGAGTVGQASNALALTPTGGGDFTAQFANANKLKFDTTLDVKMHMYIPAEYASDTIKIKFYAMFGNDWVWTETTADVSGLKAGAWGDAKATLNFADTAKLGGVDALGFILGDFTAAHTEPVLMDAMTISDRFGKKMKEVIGTQYKATFTKGIEAFQEAGWSDAAKVKVEATGGELVLTPDTSAWPRAVIYKDTGSINELDFKGPVTIKMRVFIPSAYVGDTFPMALFLQDGSWHWWETPQVANANYKRGEWNDIAFELDFSNAPGDWLRGPVPNRIGIMFYNSPGFNGAAFKIDDLEVVGVSLVDDSEPLFMMDFSQPIDLDTFKVDAAAAGSLSESVLISAKKWGYKIAPLGWLANSWAGNKGDEAALNIASSQDVKDPKHVTYVLTPRGEEVVNGLYGIKATSVEITPPPVKPAK